MATSVMVATIEFDKTCRESKVMYFINKLQSVVYYRGKDPNLMTVTVKWPTTLISYQRGRFSDTRKLKTTIVRVNSRSLNLLMRFILKTNVNNVTRHNNSKATNVSRSRVTQRVTCPCFGAKNDYKIHLNIKLNKLIRQKVTKQSTLLIFGGNPNSHNNNSTSK